MFNPEQVNPLQIPQNSFIINSTILGRTFGETCMNHPTHMRLITININCVLIVMWYLTDLKGGSAPSGLTPGRRGPPQSDS